jgi:hypothetical protein
MTVWAGGSSRYAGRHTATVASLDSESHATLTVSLSTSQWHDIYTNASDTVREILLKADQEADRKASQPFGFV